MPQAEEKQPKEKLISVVIPVFNEEENVLNAYLAVTKVFSEKLEQYDLEIVFTDNASLDGTFGELDKLAKSDPRVRVIRFVRNFGFNKSLLTGYRFCRGDAAIQIDCDLQDPPDVFPQFLELWENGHDVVVGLRQKRPEAAWLLAARKSFYRFLSMISPDNIVLDGGDFRLVDKAVLDQLRDLSDANPYVRGLTASLARNLTGFPYERREREFGQSKFPITKLIPLALDGIVTHSTVPLRMATIFGLIVGLTTFILAVFYASARIFLGFSMPSGFTTIVILELMSISINALFLGVLGEYIGRIYRNAQARPITVIRDSLNL
ncbi:MAG: glycosyltransferase family 2 protein [Hyphomicrobiales bacterium]|uniref:glycosyltransferase family 2 protein n=1 Tax=Roseibium polysiphoniae TaxID=2571221 RepID=UPI003296EF52